EVKLFQLHNWRSISRTAKGLDPGPQGSINKLWWSEMSKRLHDTAMAVLGEAAPLWRGATENPGDGAWQRSWLYYQASSILAGTEKWAALRATPEGKLRHEQVMYWDKLVKIRDFRKPTIAAVQGTCAAAGLMLACMCDLIIAADDARFSNPVARMSGVGVE